MKYHKVSFCIVCMNRLSHLQQTLSQNIEDNLMYSNVEFILLDYSSTDGLSTWIGENMQEYLETGILKYYHLNNAIYFNRSHSRNLAFKLSTGDIVCNLDADNYTGENFANYVNQQLQNPTDYLVADYKKEFYYIRDVVGRVALHKKAFEEVKGYCEEMQGYGFEDNDFYQRLKSIGKNEIIIDNLKYLKAIQHSDDFRIENEKQSSEIQRFYIHYSSLNFSEVYLLLKNGQFQFFKLKPNQNHNPAHQLIDNTWESGTWIEMNNQIHFEYLNGTIQDFMISTDDGSIVNELQKFHQINDQSFLNFLKIQLPLITNQAIMKRRKNDEINSTGFGEALFTSSNILTLV